MTQSKNDEESNSIVKPGVPKRDFIKQLRKEMHMEDEEDVEGAPKSIGSNVAYLRKDGKIENIVCWQYEGEYGDGEFVYEPGTPGFEAILQEHGPLIQGKPHCINIYPTDAEIKRKPAEEKSPSAQE